MAHQPLTHKIYGEIMAKTRATFEKHQREKAKREKKQQKLADKKNKEKEEQLNIEDMTPEEFIAYHQEQEEELL
jgi:isocitrate dehydrogenase